jgi:hypothetical protein
MPTIHTPFGPIEALPGAEFHPDGSPRSCIPARACPLETPLGTLVPQYTANTLRRRQMPVVSFHPGGMLRNVPLEDQTVVPTPAGPMPAEQVTLYRDGALNRIFPLNGALSGYWTQEDEVRLAEPLALDTPVGPVEALFIALHFNLAGGLRSMTLWPTETIEVPSPLGSIRARIGVSFFDSGALSALEPAGPTAVRTPLGELLAFDADAIGLCGDACSLRFRENGSLLGLKTAHHAFDVVQENRRVRRIGPALRTNPCDGERIEAAPMALEFGGGRVSFRIADQPRISAAFADVSPAPFHAPLPSLNAACVRKADAW